MPVNLGKDKKGCFARWGKKGAKYYYECGNENERLNARKKAIAQGVAIGDISNYSFQGEKISFDFDGVLSTEKGKELIKKYIESNNIVYIISARNRAEELYKVGEELGVLKSRIYATGSNLKKIEKIRELKINKHYDNNQDVVDSLGEVGEKF